MSKSIILPLCVIATVVSLGTSPVHGDIVYTNLGAGDSYNTTSSVAVTGNTSGIGRGPDGRGHDYDYAVSFTVPGMDFDFVSAELGMSFAEGPNAMDVFLMSDNGSGRPGSVLETIPVTGVPLSRGSLATASSTLNPTLSAGTTYWLAASTSGDTTMRWWINNQDARGFARNIDNHPWQFFGGTNPQLAVRINGIQAVPAPGAALLGIMGLSLVGSRRRRGA